MSFFSALYLLIIGPIEILFEFIYIAFSNTLGDYGLSIIILSLVMNLLLLPLYKRADAIQDAERQQEKDMAGAVAHIKKTFRGDERFMMLQTYYRQNHYKPFYVLKGFLPLMLEIPFFIAAYHFLSNYRALSGASFGLIADLGAPDGLLHAAGLTVNLLPVLMTAINFISSAIYTKGFPLKDKLQLYGMALVFLVLLYDSPSALVIYWTLNNLFSLVKNLIVKLFLRKRKKERKARKAVRPAGVKMFAAACCFLAVLTGMLIPSAVIVSSPEEFALPGANYYSPLRHILSASLLSFGLFVVWFGIFYYMFSPRGRRIFSLTVLVLSGAAVANYMFFGTGLGLISAELHFDVFPHFRTGEILLNCAVIAVLAGVLIFLGRKKEKIARAFVLLMAVAVTGMSVLNMVNIRNSINQKEAGIRHVNDNQARITLSRDGKNVIFIMLDAAISGYIPYIFEENEGLAEQFAGFVYYPDTVSFGRCTNFGTPSLYGGYEYTPEEMNRRDSEPLVKKQNEALAVMPVLFRDAGYQVTVFDPPYAGYSWVPDLTVFDEYEGIQAYNTEQGQFVEAPGEVLSEVWQRNFFCYSLLKCLPVAVQPAAYDNGNYFGTKNVHNQFENSYAVLKSLEKMTRIQDGDANTFLSMCNNTTHEPTLLSVPDYEPMENADASAWQEGNQEKNAAGRPAMYLDSETRVKYYRVDTAAMLRVGEWLDYLREQGVYDNTRIIIASDHGRNLNEFKDMQIQLGGSQVDLMFFNPLLMVKDFGSTAAFATDADSFMTLADVPTLLTDDVITDPVNPFTGKAITSEGQKDGELHILDSGIWQVGRNNGNTFLPGIWYSVRDSIFDKDNWAVLGEW